MVAISIAKLLLTYQSGNAFAPSIHLISPPEGFDSIRPVQISRDGKTLLCTARTGASPGQLYLWNLTAGLSRVPDSPFGPLRSSTALTPRLSADGNVVLGYSAGAPIVWNRSSNTYASLGISPFTVGDLSDNGNRVYMSREFPQGTHEFIEWIPFVRDSVPLRRSAQQIRIILSDSSMTSNLFGVRERDATRLRFLHRLYRWSRTGSGETVTELRNNFPSRELYGYTKNAGNFLVHEGDTERISSENRLRIYGPTNQAVVTFPQDVSPFPFEFYNSQTFSDLGKFCVAGNYLWRADAGVLNPQMFLQRYFPAQTVADNFQRSAFYLVSGQANTLVGSTNGGIQIAYHPETFRRKIGERYSISTRLVVRPWSIRNLFLDDDSSRDHLELNYNFTAPWGVASSGVPSVPVRVTYNDQISLGSGVSYNWSNSTSSTLQISCSATDTDQGSLVNQSVLSGPFSVTVDELRSGGKTFGLAGDVSLRVESTYLGPILDPNS